MSASNSFSDQLQRAGEQSHTLRSAIAEVIVGQEQVVEQCLWALIGGGHVLLEGAPGLGKTLLVKTLANCLELEFSRIQFTPDLMPSDVTGTNILLRTEDGQRRFSLHKGPIFSQIVLADEINRATPKTQSALLEAMQESACTIAGHSHPLPSPFFVMATENPIEMEGTYPLPEAQLDRFLLQVLVRSPDEDEMTEILQRTTGHETKPPRGILCRDEVMQLRSLCRDIAVAKPVLRYAARLVGASQPASDQAPEVVRRGVRYGAGVRAAQALVLAAKASAVLNGRPNVAFSDIRRVAKPVLRHRLIRSFEGEADGTSPDQIIEALIETVDEHDEGGTSR